VHSHNFWQAAVGDIGVIAEITDVEILATGRANLKVDNLPMFIKYQRLNCELDMAAGEMQGSAEDH
jgi:hypothetical protein